MLGSETAEMNLRTVLFPCYLQLLGVDVGERDCGDESADGAVITMLLPCCWGAAAGREVAERNLHGAVTMLFAAVGVQLLKKGCGEESADGAVTMLFAAVGGRCWGARLRR